jgi:curli biogenesis system outer membrane secretion channel CsgG
MKSEKLILIFALLWSITLLAQSGRPSIAVVTFKNPSNYPNSTIGTGLTDILTTELQNTGKYRLLERTHVTELTKEMDFGNSEYARTATFAKKGQMLGAQYILMGQVTNFSYNEQLERQQKTTLLGGAYIETVYQQNADVRVDFRLVDVASGETVLSQAGEAHQQNVSKVSEQNTWYRYISSGFATGELSSSLIGRTTLEAVKDVVRKLNALSATVRAASQEASMNQALDQMANAKGQLLGDAGGGTWIVGLGASAGIQKGDHLIVTHDNVIRDKAGHVLYKKPLEIGTMEVTDVSMADRAEARLLPSASGTQRPQENDIVRVDVEYAHTLRGGGSASNSSSSSGNSSGSSAGASAQLDQYLRRADSYMNDKFWSQALDEYTKAAGIAPNDPRVLDGQASAHYMLGDFLEADDLSNKLLRTDSPLSVPVAHYHSMGLCIGRLLIKNGSIAYSGRGNDNFEVPAASVLSIEIRRVSKSFMSNEQAPDWPVLEVRLRDTSGHEKKYDFLPYIYSKKPNASGKNYASAFPMDESDITQLRKFEYSLLAIIRNHVK